MLKNILKLEGAKQLTKNSQREIKGGLEASGGDGCSCVFTGDRGFLVLEIVGCSAASQAQCESRLNGRFFNFGGF